MWHSFRDLILVSFKKDIQQIIAEVKKKNKTKIYIFFFWKIAQKYCFLISYDFFIYFQNMFYCTTVRKSKQ